MFIFPLSSNNNHYKDFVAAISWLQTFLSFFNKTDNTESVRLYFGYRRVLSPIRKRNGSGIKTISSDDVRYPASHMLRASRRTSTVIEFSGRPDRYLIQYMLCIAS